MSPPITTFTVTRESRNETTVFKTGVLMRTLEEMRLRSEDVIRRATDLSTPKDKKPSQLEEKLAADNIKLIVLFTRAHKLVALGFIDEWKAILQEAGVR